MRSIILVSLVFVVGCSATPAAEPTSQPTEHSSIKSEQYPEEATGNKIPNAVEGTNVGNDPLAAPDDVAAVPTDADVTPSGLAFKVLREGSGVGGHPKLSSKVTIHYTGWTADGKRFDSSVERDEPNTFPLNKLIKGWQEGLPLMTRGEKRRFWIPADLAYATKPEAPQGTLVFDIELIDFTE